MRCFSLSHERTACKPTCCLVDVPSYHSSFMLNQANASTCFSCLLRSGTETLCPAFLLRLHFRSLGPSPLVSLHMPQRGGGVSVRESEHTTTRLYLYGTARLCKISW